MLLRKYSRSINASRIAIQSDSKCTLRFIVVIAINKSHHKVELVLVGDLISKHVLNELILLQWS
jgi:hypothetical protein